MIAFVAASAAAACGGKSSDVDSSQREVVGKADHRETGGSEHDSERDSGVGKSPGAEDDGTTTTAVASSAGGFAPNVPSDTGDAPKPNAGWDAGVNVDISGDFAADSPSYDVGDEPTACAANATRRVDIPRVVRESGGTWELRRVVDKRSDEVPDIVSAGTVALDPNETELDIATDGSHFQVVLFRDNDGRLVDAQWHQSGCEAAAPRRSDVVLDVPEQFATIQAAIDEAHAGDTVRVGPGVYNETLTLKPNIMLLGAGPEETILDAEGEVTKLIDATGAFGASVIGFTFRNVGMGGTCGNPEEPLSCAGEHYPVALYADGHSPESESNACCHFSTFFAAHNVFSGNAYGVMAYHRVQAMLFDNVFVDNANAVVVNYASDAFALVENNVFAASNGLDIASSSARVFASHNAFEGNLDCVVDYIQRGRYSCNAFTGNITCDVLTPHDRDNIDFDQADAVATAVEAGCVDAPGDGGTIQWFDVAGETGREFGE